MAKNKLQHYGDERLGLIPGQDVPTSILDMLNVGRPGPKRERIWEKKNSSTTFRIPAPLADTAKHIRGQILGIAEFDESGKPRGTATTADQVAAILLDWAIKQVEQNPRIIPANTNPHGKGKLTLHIAAWDTWATAPAIPKPTRRKKTHTTRLVISYRIPPETVTSIRNIAENNSVPTGEVFLRLLQIALDGYLAMKFRLTDQPEVVIKTSGWKATE